MATSTGPCGVTTLDHEAFDDTVEGRGVVVTFEAELEEVSAGTGTLGGPEVKREVTVVSLEQD